MAVIEALSPSNKGFVNELRAFVVKVSDLLQQGVHVLIVDVFLPTRRDPQGIHQAIWQELDDEEVSPEPDQPLTAVSYSAGTVTTAYVEHFAVGDELPLMPLFLEPEIYVPVSFEETYRTTWDVFPTALKGLLESD